MSTWIFTIVARNCLSLALTLGDSVRLYHPEAEFRIVLTDGVEGLPGTPYSHQLVSMESMLGDDLGELKFVYNITEFCTAIKPMLFRRLFADGPADTVYYLDPDTVLFDRLDEIMTPNPGASIFLAPHLLHCRLSDDHAYPEYKHLWEGIFNLGFCGLRRSPESERFLAWWDARLRKYCFADHFDGLHTDQKWADYATVYFRSALEVVDHDGLNVAHWNLDERLLSRQGDSYLVNGRRLLLFHFSGFDFRGASLTRHVPTDLQGRYLTSTVKEIASGYRAAVRANGFESHIGLKYRHDFYSNGARVTGIHRRLYRALDPEERDARPFDSSGGFYRRLSRAGLIDRSSAAEVNYTAASLPTLGRLTSVSQGLLRLFLKLSGARRYAYLMKMFSRYARPENHAFLVGSRRSTFTVSQQQKSA